MRMIPKQTSGLTALSLLMPCVLLFLQAGCKKAPPPAGTGGPSAVQLEAGTNQPTAAELQPLQGYWEGDGSGGKCSITITGNSLHYRAGTNWFKTTFTLPAGTDPKQLNATIKDCAPPTEGSVGKVVFAIFKIEDGTLTLAEDDMSDKPPKTFSSASSHYDLKQVQPQKKNTQPPKTT